MRVLCAGWYPEREIVAWIGATRPQSYGALIAGGGESLFVAEREGAAVGFGALSHNEVTALFVDPERGRGAGRPLAATREAEARRQAFILLELWSTLNAVAFYAACGYARQGEGVMLRGGERLAVVKMEKLLL